MMDNLLAFGVPALAIVVALTGIFSVRHSTKALKERLEREKAEYAVQATAMMPTAQAYGEVHMEVGRPKFESMY